MNSKQEFCNDIHSFARDNEYLHMFKTTWQIVHLVIERFGIRLAVSYWTVNIIDVAYKVVLNYMSL
jgi:hypothetical protein